MSMTKNFSVRIKEYPNSFPLIRPGPCEPFVGDTAREPDNQPVIILVVLEGTNDIEFLRRISRTLHAHDPELPDLGVMEREGRIVFVPFGGGKLDSWIHRFESLGLPELHIYDRELPPVTDERSEAARQVNWRKQCVALLTCKRAMENYLAPQALFAARGVEVRFGDTDDVADLAARACYRLCGGRQAWERINPRRRRAMRHKAKRWLNTLAAERMTPELLAERDPRGEVPMWLRTIAHLTNGSSTSHQNNP